MLKIAKRVGDWLASTAIDALFAAISALVPTVVLVAIMWAVIDDLSAKQLLILGGIVWFATFTGAAVRDWLPLRPRPTIINLTNVCCDGGSMRRQSRSIPVVEPERKG